MSTAKAGWQKEREAQQKRKQYGASQQGDNQEWQQNRNHMLQKKEEAKQAEESAPEFLKVTLKQKPKAPAENEGPTIEELDDGTDIPPWHRANAPEKPEWVVLLLLAAAKEAEEADDQGGSNRSLEEEVIKEKEDDEPEWMKQAKNLKTASPKLPSKPTKKATGEATASHKRSADRLKCKSASEALAVPEDDKPEWMKGAEAIKHKKKAQETAREKFSSPVPRAEAKPAWMAQRSKIKGKGESFSDSFESREGTSSPVPTAEAQPEWMAQRSKIKEESKKPDSPNEPKKTLSKSKSVNEEPAWMAQRSKIKQKTKEEDTPPEHTGAKDSQGAEAKQTLQKFSSTPDQPEWMAQRSKIKQESKKPEPSPESQSPKSKSEGEEPAWMAQRSKIKHKVKEEVKTSDNTKPADVDNTPIQEKIAKQESPPEAKTTKPDEKPAWMTQRSKIKQKAKEEVTTTKPPPDDTTQPADEPEWMKQKLRPRVSILELKSNKVQEKLQKKRPIRQSSIQLTTEELTSNIVQTKLATKRKGEMEWMKAKLKPSSSSAHHPQIQEEEDDGKPAWMRHKLKPRVSIRELNASKVKEKLASKEPIRQSSIRLTKEELTANTVKEKLASKEPIRQSSIRLTKEDLAANVVQEKLDARRSNFSPHQSPIQREEMVWMKQKLRHSQTNIPKQPSTEQQRPGWFKEASVRGLVDLEDENDESTKHHHHPQESIDSRRRSGPTRQGSGERPGWFKEASSRGFKISDEEGDKEDPTQNGVSKSRESKQEKQGETKPQWMQEAHKKMPSLGNLLAGDEDDEHDESARSENQIPAPKPSGHGSARRIATMPEKTAQTMRSGLKKRPSGNRPAVVSNSPERCPKETSKSNLQSAEKDIEPEIDPDDLFKIRPPAKPVTTPKNVSSIKGGNATGSKGRTITKGGKSKSMEENLGFWGSMMDFSSATNVDGQGASSSDSDETDAQAARPIDFTASMNDIGAVMMDSSETDSLLKPLGAPLSFGRKKDSAPSLLMTVAERRRSRMSMSKKDRTKSRSRSGGSSHGGSTHDKKKEKKDRDKDKKKRKKKDKESDETKKDKKKETKDDKKTSKTTHEEENPKPEWWNKSPEKKVVATTLTSSSMKKGETGWWAQAQTPESPKPRALSPKPTAVSSQSSPVSPKPGWWAAQAPDSPMNRMQSTGTKPLAQAPKSTRAQSTGTKSTAQTPKSSTTRSRSPARTKPPTRTRAQSPNPTEAPKAAWWMTQVPKNETKNSCSDWASAEAPNGKTYYYNTKTQETTWTKPPCFTS